METCFWDRCGSRWRDLEGKKVLLSSLHFFAFAAESSEADLLTQTSNGAAGVLSLRGLHSTLERQAPLGFSGNRELQASQDLSVFLFSFLAHWEGILNLRGLFLAGFG